MFRSEPAHAGVSRDAGPSAFHRVKWTFPTGDRIVSSPVYRDGVIYFGGDDGNVYAVNAADGRQLWKHATGGPVPATPALAGDLLYIGSYDGKFYALEARTGVTRWKFATGGERRFEAKGLHGLQPRNQTIPDQFDVYLSSPVVAGGAVFFGSGDGNLYALDAATGKEKWRYNASGSWIITSPAVTRGKVVAATSDSSLYLVLDAQTGKPVVQKQGNAYVFASPAVAGDIVYVGVLNGSLEARDLASGDVLWEFRTDASRRNEGWVLTSERKFNSPFLFRSSWREAPVVATERQFGIGAIFSTPLVVDGVVYFGSTDGSLYAVE
jgi:outer membrane protein assembly factor BamB